MSILIDDIDEFKSCNVQIGDKWYIAKSLPFYGFWGFISRLKDAWRVLLDKSRAYHFKEDELMKSGE